jgi:hypothetical protein
MAQVFWLPWNGLSNPAIQPRDVVKPGYKGHDPLSDPPNSTYITPFEFTQAVMVRFPVIRP